MATPYTISYNGWESCFEDFGDDIVYFTAIVRHNDRPDKPFPIILSFKMIQKQSEEMFPGAADIIKQAKKHLKGWGPQDSVLVREMEELGIDLEAVVLKIVTTQINLDKEFQRIDALDTNVDKMSDILGDLKLAASDIKSETITYYSLCEQLEKLITDEVVDRYPELLNSSSDCILQLQTILTHHIPSLVNDLTSLINEAKQKN